MADRWNVRGGLAPDVPRRRVQPARFVEMPLRFGVLAAHDRAAVAALAVCVETTVPSTASWNVASPDAPLCAMAIVVVPLGVAFIAGAVNDAVRGASGVALDTVTAREAVAVAPVSSVTVATSVWGPFASVDVSSV